MVLKIKNIIKILIYLLISKKFYIKSNEIVILPFNSSYKSQSFYDYTFIDKIQERNIYTLIDIGEPQYKIKAILSFDNPYFALIPNKSFQKINNNINNSFEYYNFSKSNTFKNITCLNEYFLESRNDIIAEEKFKIKVFDYKNNINRDIILNNMKIIVGIDNKYNYKIFNLNIGFRIIIDNENNEKQNYNFIYQLKERKITNDYYWSIFFDVGKRENGKFLYNSEQLFNATGKLIIGDLPSIYEPNKFHKSQLLTIYSFAKNLVLTWAIDFNSIYYYNKINKITKDTYTNVHININNYLIQAPNSYYFHIKNDFFNEYLSNNICEIYSGNGFEAIFCHKSEKFNEVNLKEFPTLYMQNNELQYIFEFNYLDLFLDEGDKYWFLITFPIFYEVEEWFFGIIFLRKYNLIFNQDSKTISFYNPNLPLEDEKGNSPISINNNINIKTIIIIIIIILLSLISIGLGIYLGKIVYDNKKEKKRFNELEDSFEYISREYQREKYENIPIGI